MNNPQRFWNWATPVQNEEGTQPKERVLELYGSISEDSWLEDDITPKMFHDELFGDTGPVTIWLNSPGGDCVAASQIYTMLMDYPDEVTVKIDGIAASAASVIAMAGTKVLMAPTGLMMVHDPLTLAYGNKEDMRKAIEMLDEVKESIINAYEIKTGLSRAKLSHYMEQETWMNAKKAIELGFADDILEDRKKSAKDGISYSFSGKAAEIRLLNKLTDKSGQAAPVSDRPRQQSTLAAVAEPEPRPEGTGASITELEKRLGLLK